MYYSCKCIYQCNEYYTHVPWLLVHATSFGCPHVITCINIGNLLSYFCKAIEKEWITSVYILEYVNMKWYKRTGDWLKGCLI